MVASRNGRPNFQNIQFRINPAHHNYNYVVTYLREREVEGASWQIRPNPPTLEDSKEDCEWYLNQLRQTFKHYNCEKEAVLGNIDVLKDSFGSDPGDKWKMRKEEIVKKLKELREDKKTYEEDIFEITGLVANHERITL